MHWYLFVRRLADRPLGCCACWRSITEVELSRAVVGSLNPSPVGWRGTGPASPESSRGTRAARASWRDSHLRTGRNRRALVRAQCCCRTGRASNRSRSNHARVRHAEHFLRGVHRRDACALANPMDQIRPGKVRALPVLSATAESEHALPDFRHGNRCAAVASAFTDAALFGMPNIRRVPARIAKARGAFSMSTDGPPSRSRNREDACRRVRHAEQNRVAL